jgi:hypothetical protein
VLYWQGVNAGYQLNSSYQVMVIYATT